MLHLDLHGGVPIYRQVMDQVRRQILDGLIYEQLLESYLNDAGYRIGDEQVILMDDLGESTEAILAEHDSYSWDNLWQAIEQMDDELAQAWWGPEGSVSALQAAAEQDWLPNP